MTDGTTVTEVIVAHEMPSGAEVEVVAEITRNYEDPGDCYPKIPACVDYYIDITSVVLPDGTEIEGEAINDRHYVSMVVSVEKDM